MRKSVGPSGAAMLERICLATLDCGRRLAKFLLPYGLVRMIQQRKLSPLPIPRRSERVGVGPSTIIPISENAFVKVYWVNEEFGPGPSASVYVENDEVMRLDAFGGRRGHMHFNTHQARQLPKGGVARVYFVEGDIFAHIDRSAFELKVNLAYALKTNRDPSIRRFRVDPQKLSVVAERMRDAMRQLMEKYGTAVQRQPNTASRVEGY
jgi:hypothetical protein